MSGYGLDEYGLGPYGGLGGGGGGLALAGAYAVGTRTVRVALTVAPRAVSANGVGDALNPATWFLTRLSDDAAYLVIGVAAVDPVTFEVSTLQAFGAHTVDHLVGSATLVEPDGSEIGSPLTATFVGVSRATQRIA